MVRSITQTLAVVSLVVGSAAAAQADCFRRSKPSEPQRTSVSYAKGRPDQSPPTLHVAGGVATTLVFDEAEVGSAALAGEAGKRFRPLEVGTHSVVVIPKHDLAYGEHLSLMVTLKDGTEVPFDLVSTMLDHSSDGQVDVVLDAQDTETIQKALQACQARVDALELEVEHHLEEETSVDGALAALLAKRQDAFTPFTSESLLHVQDGGADIAVITYKRKDQKIDLHRAAVVFEVANAGTTTWKLEDIRLISESYNVERPFTVRASTRSIVPGAFGRFAVVIDATKLWVGPVADRLVLELWRAGVSRPDRVAAVELVAVDDPNAPLQFPRRMQAK